MYDSYRRSQNLSKIGLCQPSSSCVKEAQDCHPYQCPNLDWVSLSDYANNLGLCIDLTLISSKFWTVWNLKPPLVNCCKTFTMEEIYTSVQYLLQFNRLLFFSTPLEMTVCIWDCSDSLKAGSVETLLSTSDLLIKIQHILPQSHELLHLTSLSNSQIADKEKKMDCCCL